MTIIQLSKIACLAGESQWREAKASGRLTKRAYAVHLRARQTKQSAGRAIFILKKEFTCFFNFLIEQLRSKQFNVLANFGYMDSTPHSSLKATRGDDFVTNTNKAGHELNFYLPPRHLSSPLLLDVFTHARRAPSEVYKEDTAFVRSFFGNKRIPD